MQYLGPVLRPSQKFFAVFLLSCLFFTGIAAGLLNKLTLSPQQSAVIYYAEAKNYIHRMEKSADRPELIRLYRDQASYYLLQASIYAPDYDPDNIQAAINNFSDSKIVTLSAAQDAKAITAAYRAIGDE